MKPLAANDYLWNTEKFEIPAICAVFGKDSFLKFHAVRAIRDNVLNAGDAEFSLSRFDGTTAEIKDVLSDVATRAMFGGGRRLVWMEDADAFLTKHRDSLEHYAESPAPGGVLLLELDGFPSTTKLYKKLIDVGLIVDCAPLPEKEIPKWIVRWAKVQHKTPCDANAADLLVDLIGPELGLLDQELAKLSLYVPPKGMITLETVRQHVSARRMLEVYKMLNLALDGKAAETIRELDKLLLDKEFPPYRILNNISYTLRELAAATQLVIDGEKTGKKISVSTALNSVISKKFLLNQAEQQLLKLGRRRGAKLLQWLLQADLDIKGDSRCEPRLILETLLLRIADPRLK